MATLPREHGPRWHRAGAARRRDVGALWLGLLGAACGGAGAPGAAAGARSELDLAAAHYDTSERPHAVLGARDRGAVARAVAGVGRDLGFALRGDGRLALLAQRFAGACRDGAQPRALNDAARAAGLVEPAFELICARAAPRAGLADALAAELVARARALPAPATHFGVFVSDDQTSAAALLSRRPLALMPVPRRVDVGTPLRLRGRIDAVLAQPRLVVHGPSGEQSWPGGAGPDFDMQVPTPHAGCYRVELLARAGERVERLAELHADARAARSADACAAAGRSPPTAPELVALRRELERRIAQLRAANGVQALVVDAQLEAAAARADADPARAPARPSPADARAAGGTLLVPGRAQDVDGLWNALAGDAGQRAQLLDAGVTHLGVSVRSEAGGLTAAVSLARFAPAVDVELAPARLLDAINRNRAARGAPALRPDPTLTRVARHSAGAFFAKPERNEREIVAEANAELERFGLSYRRVAAVAMLVTDPLDAAALEPALETGAGAAGVAVAQGVRAGGGRTLAVVVALGWDR
jgi:hypothetical protein